MKENQEKRERAERKMVEEVALQRRRQEDLDALKKTTDQMLETKRMMERNVKSHKLYEVNCQEQFGSNIMSLSI